MKNLFLLAFCILVMGATMAWAASDDDITKADLAVIFAKKTYKPFLCFEKTKDGINTNSQRTIIARTSDEAEMIVMNKSTLAVSIKNQKWVLSEPHAGKSLYYGVQCEAAY